MKNITLIILLLSVFYFNKSFSEATTYVINLNTSDFKNPQNFGKIYTQEYGNTKINFEGRYLSDLLKGVKNCEEIQVLSADNFVTELTINELNECEFEGACPVIFFDKSMNWPKKSLYGGYVGPYYLGWVGQKSKQVPREMWGWNVKSIVCKKKKNEYIALNKIEIDGKNIFRKNCLGCHDVTNIVSDKIGTNLIYPLSPLEYFNSIDIFKKFVRNPQSIRKLNKDKMLGFSEKEVSKEDLDKIISYLNKMIKKRSSLN